MQLGSNPVAIGTLILLVVFGWLYNRLVSWLEAHGYDEGYTALLVIGGNLVTLLLALPLYAWVMDNCQQDNVVGLLGCLLLANLTAFSCSGLPMTLGSMARHARRRHNAIQNHARRR